MSFDDNVVVAAAEFKEDHKEADGDEQHRGVSVSRDDANPLGVPWFTRTASPTWEWRSALHAGSLLDAQDDERRWYEAVVLDADSNSVLVHFVGWSSSFERRYRRTSACLAPHRSQTFPFRRWLQPGQALELLESAQWFLCDVVAVDHGAQTVTLAPHAPGVPTTAKPLNSTHLAEGYTHFPRPPNVTQEVFPHGSPEQTLLFAAQYGDVPMLATLLQDGVDVNTRGPDGATAMSRAAVYNQPAAVAFLGARGADVNAQAQARIRSMHAASRIFV